MMADEKKEALMAEMKRLRERYELSKKAGPDYFEPGMMEYLDQSFGSFDEKTGEMVLRFEAKGTRYEGRTPRIESVKTGEELVIARENTNAFNSNNFKILDTKGRNLGNVSASLCNALAPLYDEGKAEITGAFVSFVEPISKRSRYAKQGMLFVEMHIRLQME